MRGRRRGSSRAPPRGAPPRRSPRCSALGRAGRSRPASPDARRFPRTSSSDTSAAMIPAPPAAIVRASIRRWTLTLPRRRPAESGAGDQRNSTAGVGRRPARALRPQRSVVRLAEDAGPNSSVHEREHRGLCCGSSVDSGQPALRAASASRRLAEDVRRRAAEAVDRLLEVADDRRAGRCRRSRRRRRGHRRRRALRRRAHGRCRLAVRIGVLELIDQQARGRLPPTRAGAASANRPARSAGGRASNRRSSVVEHARGRASPRGNAGARRRR